MTYYEVWSSDFLPDDREFYGRCLSARDAKRLALKKANETGKRTEVITVSQHHRETLTIQPG